MTTGPTTLLASRITVLPDLRNGRPSMRGLRVTVATPLGYLAAGETIDDVLRQHPILARDHNLVCIECASALMNRRYEIKPLVA